MKYLYDDVIGWDIMMSFLVGSIFLIQCITS